MCRLDGCIECMTKNPTRNDDPRTTTLATMSVKNVTIFLFLLCLCDSIFKFRYVVSLPCVIYLTNRFHVAVRLFSNRSQMTSKCGKNKKVAHEAIAECVTDVLTTFLTSSVIYY